MLYFGNMEREELAEVLIKRASTCTPDHREELKQINVTPSRRKHLEQFLDDSKKFYRNLTQTELLYISFRL